MKVRRLSSVLLCSLRCLALWMGLIQLLPLRSGAQEVVLGDTLPHMQLPEPVLPRTLPAPTFSLQLPDLQFLSEENPYDTRAINQSIRDTWKPEPSRLLRWDEGYLVGFHGTDVYPLIGSRSVAGVSAIHHFDDRWTLSASAGVSHFVMPYFTSNSASTSALLSYKATENVILNAFANYQAPSFMSTMRSPSSWRWGGYVTLQTDNHRWGVDLGTRREYNPYTGRMESIPIVMPYYNLQGQKLGFDFGGLIKSVIINHQMRKQEGNPFGPAGPPPAGVKPAWLK